MHMSFVYRWEKGNMEKGQWDVIQQSVREAEGVCEQNGDEWWGGAEKGVRPQERAVWGGGWHAAMV